MDTITTNNSDLTSKDYFKLPFEVYYRGPLAVSVYEFKSDADTVRFRDVKAVHVEQGRAWGVTFLCKDNTGPELYFCITAGHEDATPPWLTFESEDDIDFNFACDYAVKIENDLISFEDEEIEGLDDMDYCADSFVTYNLDSVYPDFIILDSLDTRIKVDSDGYVLDDDGNRLGEERIFDIDNLDEEVFSDYSTRELWEAKNDWVVALLDKEFPQDENLRLSLDTL